MRDPAAGAISAQADHDDGPVTVGARDVSALSAIGVLFVVMLALTWHRWADPVIDHGRELNVPARLLAGEWLYRDIYYYYGPVAPYLGALLYSIFGARMGVLHAAGMASAVAILALIYWLARQLQAVPQAAATTGLVLVLCVLAPTLGNYIQPYAYAALYGTVCSLLALTCSVRHLSAPRGRWLLAAGIGVGKGHFRRDVDLVLSH